MFFQPDLLHTKNQTITQVLGGSNAPGWYGPATLTLSAANTFTGTVRIGGGTLSSTAHNSTASASGLGAATNNISIAAGAALELAATGGVTTLTGNISGAGSISQNNGSSFAVSLAGDNSGFSGTYTMQTGCLALSFNSATAGSASATWVLNGNTGSPRIGARYGSAAQVWLPGLTTGTANTIKLGSVSTTSTSIQIGNNTSQASQTGETTWEIGELNTSTTFAGVVVDTVVGSTAFTSSKVHVKKVGSGTLTLTGTNTYTGVTTFAGGTISAATLANGGANSNIGAATNAASNMVFTGGTLKYTGGTASTDHAITVNTGEGTLEASGSGALTRSGTASVASGATLTLSGTTANNVFSGVISGDGGLTKNGSGSWTTSAKNTFTGATSVVSGTLKHAYTGTTTQVYGAIDVSSGATIDFAATNSGKGFIVSGALTGTGAVTQTGIGYVQFNGDMGAFAGSLNVSAGQCYILIDANGSSNMAVTVNGAGTSGTIIPVNDGASSSGTISFGSLSGTAQIKPYASGIAGTCTISIGGLGTNTSFGGTLEDNGVVKVATTKVGAGTQTLSGTNTYTGTTTVNGGTLLVNGSLASGSAVTVNSGILGGTGTINGAVTIANTVGTYLMSGTGSGNTGTLTLEQQTTFGGSNAGILVNTNGTTTVSKLSWPDLVTSQPLNSVRVDFGAGQNLDAGTYDVFMLGITSTFSGSATNGTPPANRTTLSMGTSVNNLQATVS